MSDHAQRYGHRHRAIRATLLGELRRGVAMTCSRCAQPLDARAPDKAFHLDHADDGDAAQYRGLAHARCNIAAPGVRGAAADSVARYGGEVRGPAGSLSEPVPRYSAWVAAIHHEIAAEQSTPCLCGHCPGGVPVLVEQVEPEVEQPQRGFAY